MLQMRHRKTKRCGQGLIAKLAELGCDLEPMAAMSVTSATRPGLAEPAGDRGPRPPSAVQRRSGRRHRPMAAHGFPAVRVGVLVFALRRIPGP